jgi:hypothetical protein
MEDYMTEKDERLTLLRDSLQDLAFEFHHFQAYRRLLQESSQHAHGALCPAVQQAVTYALLLHFRLLIDFFYKPAGQDDLAAAHFSASPGFKADFLETLTAKPEWVVDVKKNLNKRLVHVTETRQEDERPRMKYYSIHFPEIDALIGGFIDALPEQFQETLKRGIEAYERRDAGCWPPSPGHTFGR